MLIGKLKSYKIYLASQSPRRHQLLTGMEIDFDHLPLDVEESYPDGLSPVEVAEYLSCLKLSPINRESFPEKTIFIACDTIVVLEGKIIGKPIDESDAIRILQNLSGQQHTVISGLTVATPSSMLTRSKETEVRFKRLTDEEIQYYISKYQPFDKAGAYGIQEWIGYIGIDSVKGSFYNIMGLPTGLLWDMLHEVVK